MIKKSKPSQRLGTVPPDPYIWDLLPVTGTPPKNFLPTPLGQVPMQVIILYQNCFTRVPANFTRAGLDTSLLG